MRVAAAAALLCLLLLLAALRATKQAGQAGHCSLITSICIWPTENQICIQLQRSKETLQAQDAL